MSREPFRPRTPAPLKTSQTPNLHSPPPHRPYGFAPDSPTSLLAPKEGGLKIKVKAGVSPEARSRVGAGPSGSAFSGLRPTTPRPVRSRLGATSPLPPLPVPSTPIASTSSAAAASRYTPAASSKLATMRRVMSASDSEESLSAYAGEADLVAMDAAMGVEAEELHEHETVLVSVRVRPPNPAEQHRGDGNNIWGTNSWNPQSIGLANPGGREDREWTFDRILDADADNAKAYAMSAKTHVRRAMEGYNALIFAYGQTASGKTHTLSGSPSAPGIIPLAIHDLFNHVRETPGREYFLRASYLELYNEALYDLLSPEGKELSLSEGRKKGEVVINGLTESGVRTAEEVRRLLAKGEENRKVGKTDWNARSSRSHCVFRVTIESRASVYDEGAPGVRTPGGRLASGDKMTRISTLSIIDLAGSERHTSSKERNAEGKHINQSLLTLKLVIGKLADMASKRNVTHVPYRDSKLTRLLQPSLSGDALISVICTLSPASANLNESLSTLSFAQGLKRVVLRAQRKEMMDPQALIQQYQEEIAELRSMLQNKQMGNVNGTGVAAAQDKRGKGSDQSDMEDRLNQLKSLILHGGGPGGSAGPSQEARPLSPTRLHTPSLGYDKTSTQLRESLHAAETRIDQLEEQNKQLKFDLDARHVRPNERIMELSDEVAGLKMIAEDYERHLREPSQKVRQDVEREWQGRVDKLEQQLEAKAAWNDKLDNQVRVLTAEKAEWRQWQSRCHEAEEKVRLIMDWLNTTLNPSGEPDDRAGPADHHDIGGGYSRSIGATNDSRSSIPELVVEAPREDYNLDFGPAKVPGGAGGRTTLTLNAKNARDKMSQIDLATLSRRFGSVVGRVGMVSEESSWDLGKMADD